MEAVNLLWAHSQLGLANQQLCDTCVAAVCARTASLNLHDLATLCLSLTKVLLQHGSTEEPRRRAKATALPAAPAYPPGSRTTMGDSTAVGPNLHTPPPTCEKA